MKTLLLGMTICVLQVAYGQDYYSHATGVGPSYLQPTDAKVEKINPFWGGQVSGYWKNFKASGGLHVGKIEKNFGSIGSINANDILVNLSLNYLYGSFPNDKLSGFYGSIGLGFYLEQAEFEANIAGKSFREKLEDKSLAFEVGGGFMFETGALDAKYIAFAASDNVTGAVMLSVMIFVTGDKK